MSSSSQGRTLEHNILLPIITTGKKNKQCATKCPHYDQSFTLRYNVGRCRIFGNLPDNARHDGCFKAERALKRLLKQMGDSCG